jgi:hypothetical protein
MRPVFLQNVLIASARPYSSGGMGHPKSDFNILARGRTCAYWSQNPIDSLLAIMSAGLVVRFAHRHCMNAPFFVSYLESQIAKSFFRRSQTLQLLSL